ncbi:MAG: NAD(P)/FAD-dependent oxidoreductase [Terrimicrobiaceae bacterium]
MSTSQKIVIAGGGAAGFFGAIAAAEADPRASVTILEKTRHVLAKVRISGGGRCNVTHACFDPREISQRYPRGGRALIGPFTRFGPHETIEWFRLRGVNLKTEADGRMFPVTDSSQSIIDCLMDSAKNAGIEIRLQTGLDGIERLPGGGFSLKLSTGEILPADRLLWATGGCRAENHPLVPLGHTIVPPVPSLFTFHIDSPWLRELPGVSVENVQVSVPKTSLKQRGPLLITHTGVSGPAILRLSAWGARELHDLDYRFPLRISWLPDAKPNSLLEEIQRRRESHGGQTVLRARWNPLPARLWEQLVLQAGIAPETKWARLAKPEAQKLTALLTATELPVTGKSMNKEEFVTCGGIPLPEVDFKTMESRLVPGLFLAGEALDIDGITGGFNFQAAWTTSWTAGQNLAQSRKNAL